MASPGRIARIMLVNEATETYGPVGIDQASEAYTLGLRNDLFDRKGSWITFSDGTRANGQAEAIAYFRDHPEVINRIRDISLQRVAHEVHSEKS